MYVYKEIILISYFEDVLYAKVESNPVLYKSLTARVVLVVLDSPR